MYLILVVVLVLQKSIRSSWTKYFVANAAADLLLLLAAVDYYYILLLLRNPLFLVLSFLQKEVHEPIQQKAGTAYVCSRI